MNNETITLKKETAVELSLLIDNLIAGKKPFYKKQKEALSILKNKIDDINKKYTHTFNVNSEKLNNAYDECIETISKFPTKVYLYDGENYIELKP